MRWLGVTRLKRSDFMRFFSSQTAWSYGFVTGLVATQCRPRHIQFTRGVGRPTLTYLIVAEPFVLDEFLHHHPCGCFKRGGKRLVLGTEDTSATNRFPHERCHGSFGAHGVTGHSGQGLQGNCGMIGIEFRVGRLLGVRSHSQCSRAMYGRYSKGRVEEGFQENTHQISADTLRVDCWWPTCELNWQGSPQFPPRSPETARCCRFDRRTLSKSL